MFKEFYKMDQYKPAITTQPVGYYPQAGAAQGQAIQMVMTNPVTGLDYLQSLSEIRIHQVIHLAEGTSFMLELKRL